MRNHFEGLVVSQSLCLPLLHHATGIFVYYLLGYQRDLRRGIQVPFIREHVKLSYHLSITDVYIITLQRNNVFQVSRMSEAKVHLNCMFPFVLCIKEVYILRDIQFSR